MYLPELSRVMRFGAYSVNFSGNTSFSTVDGFNLATNTWDAAGTYANCPSNGAAYGNGKVLSGGGGYLFDAATQVWSAVSVGGVVRPRAPWVWDSARNHFFGLCFGDNQLADISLGVVAAKVVGSTMSQITFNNSAALTQFIAERPLYAGLLYDPLNDHYLFYCGSSPGAQGRVYKITPNNTSVWDMTLFTYGSGGVTPVNPPDSGVCNKFTYVPALKGIVMMADRLYAPSNLYFMRTA